MTIGEYNFVITNLATGNVIDVVELGSFYWDEIYNAPGAGLATARLDAPTTTPNNFKDWKRALWVVKSGNIQWGGIVGKTQLRGETKVLNVPVHGFFHYFMNRYLRDASGMTFGQLVRVSDIEWDDVDQFNIFKDMIDHAQSFTDGNIGMGVSWDALSGVPVRLVYTTFAVKNIGNALKQLAARQFGFSFRQVYEWVGNKPTAKFHLEYPSHNTTVDDALIYQPERPIIIKTAVSRVLKLNGTSTRATAPTVSTASATGLRFVFKIDLDTWAPTDVECVVSKYDVFSSNRAFRIMITTFNRVRLDWSTDGLDVNQAVSDILSFSSGEKTIVVTIDFTSGDVNFYQSDDDGATLTLINTVSGSATSLFDSAAPIEIGSNNLGQTLLTGKLHFVQVFPNVAGTGAPFIFFDARQANEIDQVSLPGMDGQIYTVTNPNFIPSKVAIEETFEPAATVTNILEYDNDGQEGLVNGLVVIGEGEGNDQKLLYIQNTDGDPLWESTMSLKDVNDEDLLESRGNQALDFCSNNNEQISLELDRNINPVASEAIIGSTARVSIADKFFQSDGVFWIGRKRVTLGENQDEDVTLEVVERGLIRGVFGYGAGVTGGSGQTVVTVTNLNDSGTGSLREALSAGDRYINFDESLKGGIELANDITITNLDNITIDGDGRVTIKWRELEFINCNNISFVDLIFKRTTGYSIHFKSSASGNRQLNFNILGSTFLGPTSEHAIGITDNHGNIVYGTIAYTRFDKQNKTLLIDSGVGANEGGLYFITLHDCWFHDCAEEQPYIRNGNLHIFNCLVERFGLGLGSTQNGVKIGTGGQCLAEFNRVIERPGGDTIGGDIEDIWTDVFFDDFQIVGDHTVLSDTNYEKYVANPGNGGFGQRTLDQINVVADPLANSPTPGSSNALRLSAQDVSGVHEHGGLAIKHPTTFMQFEARLRIDDDADQVTSGVMISWPNDDLARFPVVDNPEGPNPAGGEFNWFETFNNRDTRNPIESFVHRLAVDAIPPYTSDEHDRTVVNYQHTGIDGSTYVKVVGSITPDEVYVEINDGDRIILTDNPDIIATWDMKPTLQNDAWSDTPPTTPIHMYVDYVLVRRFTPKAPLFLDANWLAPETGATDAIVRAINNALSTNVTETEQNSSSIFTPPYTYYPAPTVDADLMRFSVGAKEGGPTSTRFISYTPVAQDVQVNILDNTIYSAKGNNGPHTLANPIKDTGHSMLIVGIAPGPGESASSFEWVSPGAEAILLADYDPGGGSFVPRVRIWQVDDNGQDNFTAGWTDTADFQRLLIIPFNDLLTSVNVSNPNVGVAVDLEYNSIPVDVGYAVIALGIQQSRDEMTDGPGSYVEVLNDTNTSPFGVGIHTTVVSSGSSVKPGDPTWDGTLSGKVNYTISVFNSVSVSNPNTRIPNEDWTIAIDPDDPSTWDDTRNHSQLIVAGNRLQQGASADDISFGSGYDLAFSGSGINRKISSSLVMEDSDTDVLSVKPITGLFNGTNALVSKAQWINGNGYDPDAETGFPNDPGGQPSGVNMSTAFTGPFATHRTYFDGGPRCQYSAIPDFSTDPEAIKGSFNNVAAADEVYIVSLWQVKDWMRDGADAIIDGGMHAPAGGPASPFTVFANYQGQYEIITRDSTTALVSGSSAPPTNSRYTRAFNASDVGNWWASIFRFKLDPIAGFFEAHLNTGSGFNKVVDVPSGWGWSYADSDPDNELFYALLGPRVYCYHRYTNNLTNNWDPTYGNVRDVWMRWSSLAINPSFGIVDIISHCNYFLNG